MFILRILIFQCQGHEFSRVPRTRYRKDNVLPTVHLV